MNDTNFINSEFYSSPRKGEIYIADIDETDKRGCEMKKTRPVLILSNDSHNYSRDVVLAVPLSSLKNKRSIDLSLQIPIKSDGSNGLNMDSVAVMEHMKGISKQRLRKYLGTVNKMTMNEIHKAMLRFCDIDVLYL